MLPLAWLVGQSCATSICQVVPTSSKARWRRGGLRSKVHLDAYGGTQEGCEGDQSHSFLARHTPQRQNLHPCTGKRQLTSPFRVAFHIIIIVNVTVSKSSRAPTAL